MAIYHLSAMRISRGRGKSAVASAAYYSDEILTDHRTGIRHRMPPRAGLLHSALIMPPGVPSTRSREELWNAMEAAEIRRDANLAMLYDVALPAELTLAQNIALANSFGRYFASFLSSAVDLNVRSHSSENLNVTYMVSSREMTATGPGQKNRTSVHATMRARRGLGGSSKDDLMHTREAWTAHCNAALEALGHTTRIDHRSYKSRGIAIEPAVHVGSIAARRTSRGETMDRTPLPREVSDRNSLAVADDPSVVTTLMDEQAVPRTTENILRVIRRYVADEELAVHFAEHLSDLNSRR